MSVSLSRYDVRYIIDLSYCSSLNSSSFDIPFYKSLILKNNTFFIPSHPSHSFSIFNSYSHFLHQKACVHVLGYTFAELIGECQLVSGDIRFETIVTNVFRIAFG